MNLFNSAFWEGLAADSQKFLPELLLCGVIVLMLVLRLFKALDRFHLGGLALFGTIAAMLLTICQWRGGFVAFGQQVSFLSPVDAREFTIGNERRLQMFGGLLLFDYVTLFLRLFLFGFTSLIIWLTMITGIPDKEDSGDFYTLLLGAVIGMSLMASANHLLMVFIGVEMASLPSYALVGYLKGRRLSSEAALKYVVYGGGAAGIMLYGISLVAGKFGTGYLPDIAVQYVQAMQPGVGLDPALVLGTLFIVIGIAFKLAAVPFHFWCPDVFEGASAEVAGFLSVASKGAALALLARVTLTLGGLEPLVPDAGNSSWLIVARYFVPTLAFFAALTATFGNLAAYRQTKLKRLLAYSTIAHAGYMMMGLAVLTREGVAAVLFYLVAYLVMNLGAFAVVAFLRNMTGSEDLNDFRGLVRRAPIMVVTLSFFLLSLLGIPPLIGFFGKFFVFASLWHGAEFYTGVNESGLSTVCIALLVIGGLNTVISAVYYVKVMKVMIIDQRVEDVEGTEPKPIPELERPVIFAGLMAALTLVLGVLWGPVADASDYAVKRYLAKPPGAVSRGPVTQLGEGAR